MKSDLLADLRRGTTPVMAAGKPGPCRNPEACSHTWFEQAVEIESTEGNAMMLANRGCERPAATWRTCLLKGLMIAAFVFFTNYQSAQRAKQLQRHRNAAIDLWWHDLERQVRIGRRGASANQRRRVGCLLPSRPWQSGFGWASRKAR